MGSQHTTSADSITEPYCSRSDDSFESSDSQQAEVESVAPLLSLSRHPMVTCSQHEISKPNPKYAFLIIHHDIPHIPLSIKAALQYDGWKIVM